MNNLIEQLKKNRYAFGMWPDPECYGEELGKAMQEKAREIPKEHFNVYEGNFSNAVWSRCNKGSGAFCVYQTYRLRDTYEDEPEIVECEIKPQGDHWHYRDGGTWFSLHEAFDRQDCIGFKFADGTWYGLPVRPVNLAGKQIYGDMDINEIISGRVVVLHATHVLMRKRLDK